MSDINIGEISEALNDKMDRDAANPAELGVRNVVGWGMPDYSNPTTIASGYVATEKCWLYAYVWATGGNNQAASLSVLVNGFTVAFASVSNWSFWVNNSNMVPLDAGDVVTVSQSGNGTCNIVILPMKGM